MTRCCDPSWLTSSSLPLSSIACQPASTRPAAESDRPRCVPDSNPGSFRLHGRLPGRWVVALRAQQADWPRSTIQNHCRRRCLDRRHSAERRGRGRCPSRRCRDDQHPRMPPGHTPDITRHLNQNKCIQRRFYGKKRVRGTPSQRSDPNGPQTKFMLSVIGHLGENLVIICWFHVKNCINTGPTKFSGDGPPLETSLPTGPRVEELELP